MDNHHVNIHSSTMSCGVLELSRPESDVGDVVYAIMSHMYHPSRGQPAAVVMWSDVEESNGSRLYDSLVGGAYGAVVRSLAVENPKTGNIIRVYTWIVNHEKLKKRYTDERIARIKRG